MNLTGGLIFFFAKSGTFPGACGPGRTGASVYGVTLLTGLCCLRHALALSPHCQRGGYPGAAGPGDEVDPKQGLGVAPLLTVPSGQGCGLTSGAETYLTAVIPASPLHPASPSHCSQLTARLSQQRHLVDQTSHHEVRCPAPLSTGLPPHVEQILVLPRPSPCPPSLPPALSDPWRPWGPSPVFLPLLFPDTRPASFFTPRQPSLFAVHLYLLAVLLPDYPLD